MVWKQILKDLRKEWAWAFFYTVVATMIAMAILYLSVSFSSVQRQSAAIRSFIRQNVRVPAHTLAQRSWPIAFVPNQYSLHGARLRRCMPVSGSLFIVTGSC